MQAYWETDTTKRQQEASKILADLPEWFGLPESTKVYIDNTKQFDTLFIELDYEVVGFLSIKKTAQQTAEIDCMGVLKSAHRKGVGHQLIEEALQWCRENNLLFLQVKTLADTHPDSYYKNTRAFYHKNGFTDVEIFPELWGSENPCLQLIRGV